MTDKEFKRLKRADLIEIIYRLQENDEKQRAAIGKMRKQLEERQIKIDKAGSIADAALALNNVFGTAQNAANQYLEEIARMHRQAQLELEAARNEAARILKTAKENAAKENRVGEENE